MAAPQHVDPAGTAVDPQLGHVPPVVLAGRRRTDGRVRLFLPAGAEGQHHAADSHRPIRVEQGQAVAHPEPALAHRRRLGPGDAAGEQVMRGLVGLVGPVGEHGEVESGRELEEVGHQGQTFM